MGAKKLLSLLYEAFTSSWSGLGRTPDHATPCVMERVLAQLNYQTSARLRGANLLRFWYLKYFLQKEPQYRLNFLFSTKCNEVNFQNFPQNGYITDLIPYTSLSHVFITPAFDDSIPYSFGKSIGPSVQFPLPSGAETCPKLRFNSVFFIAFYT